MANFFPKLMTDIKSYIQKTWKIKGRINNKEQNPVSIIFKFLRNREAEKILKITGGGGNVTREKEP